MGNRPDGKSVKKFNYEFDFVSYARMSSDLTEIRDSVFVCAPEGICLEESKHPAIEMLTDYLNGRGEDGSDKARYSGSSS